MWRAGRVGGRQILRSVRMLRLEMREMVILLLFKLRLALFVWRLRDLAMCIGIINMGGWRSRGQIEYEVSEFVCKSCYMRPGGPRQRAAIFCMLSPPNPTHVQPAPPAATNRLPSVLVGLPLPLLP